MFDGGEGEVRGGTADRSSERGVRVPLDSGLDLGFDVGEEGGETCESVILARVEGYGELEVRFVQVLGRQLCNGVVRDDIGDMEMVATVEYERE